MKYISAPWRADYVKKVFKMTGCVFCRSLKMKNDREALILFRGEHNFVMLNKYPYNPGHLMIAPYKHLDSPEKADKASTNEMMDLLKRALQVLRNCYNPQGFNTGMNVGQSAGAGVKDHFHLHVIPRWTGDSNFMPLIGKTKVVIEDLDTAYGQLASLFSSPE